MRKINIANYSNPVNHSGSKNMDAAQYLTAAFKSGKAVTLDAMSAVVLTIDLLNAESSLSADVLGIPKGEWEIPTEMVGLLLPHKVTLTGAIYEKDLLTRPTLEIGEGKETWSVMDAEEFKKTLTLAYLASGKVASWSKLSDVVKPVNLCDIADHLAYDGKAMVSIDSKFPIPVNTQFIEDAFIAYDSSSVWLMAVANMCNQIAKK